MKNPFKSFRFKRPKKKIEVPWKKKGKSEHDLRKTRIGQNPENLNCPQCSYPLITVPSMASPCPNCGFTGNQHVPEKSSGKTMNLSQISLTPSSQSTFQNDPPATSFRFKLIMEPTDEILIEGEENEVILNRESLDPGNSTISGEEHILIRLNNQRFFIKDLSTNGSTFIQAKQRMPLVNNCRMVLGNILLKFTGGGDQPQQADDGKTKMFGQFNMAPSFATGTLSLINEATGKSLSFQQQKVVLNRANIDSANMSISGDKHALFEFTGGKWYVTDQSSNGATFVQVLSETPLMQKQKLLLGNRIFRFEY